MFDFKKNDQQQKNNFTLRVVVAGLFALCCFGLLSLRFWVLQVDRHEGLSARADSNRLAVVPIAPRRGEIVDRNDGVTGYVFRNPKTRRVYLVTSDRRRVITEIFPVTHYTTPRHLVGTTMIMYRALMQGEEFTGRSAGRA